MTNPSDPKDRPSRPVCNICGGSALLLDGKTHCLCSDGTLYGECEGLRAEARRAHDERDAALARVTILEKLARHKFIEYLAHWHKKTCALVNCGMTADDPIHGSGR